MYKSFVTCPTDAYCSGPKVLLHLNKADLHRSLAKLMLALAFFLACKLFVNLICGLAQEADGVRLI
jgi:hypothetical protein